MACFFDIVALKIANDCQRSCPDNMQPGQKPRKPNASVARRSSLPASPGVHRALEPLGGLFGSVFDG
jgi:hypothetical protein